MKAGNVNLGEDFAILVTKDEGGYKCNSLHLALNDGIRIFTESLDLLLV
jgi:hypothetical protein